MSARLGLISGLAVAAALVTTTALAQAAVHTDASQVHACAPLGSAGALAATDGGLILVDQRGQPRALWTALDGLPGTRVRAVMRDPAEAGIFWIGTEQGLARARIRDAALEVVKTYPSKPVHALLAHGHELYVGTWGEGVLRLRDQTLTPIAFAGAGDPARERITALVMAGGELVAASAGSGLYRLQRGAMRPAAPELARAMVWSLDVHDGVLYAGTVEGLYAVDLGGLGGLGDLGGLGELGGSGGQGLGGQGLGGQARFLADGDVRWVNAGREGVDMATFGQGVRRVSLGAAGGAAAATDMPRAALHVHALSREGHAACIATHDGLWLRSGGRGWKKAALAGLPSNDISALASDGARLWAGTFDSGLALYEAGRWRRIEHPRIDHNINALAVERGRVWVATSAGLSVIEGDRITRLDAQDGLPSRHVLAVTVLSGGGVLAGTTRGAAIIRDGAVTVIGRKQGVYIGNVWAVAEDPGGWMWLGTTKGLYRVGRDASWQRFSVATGHLRDDWVMALARSGDSLWIGTYKGGVTRLDRAGAVAHQATHVGEAWVNPGGLTWRGDTLYVATMDGLLVSDGATLRPASLALPGRDTTAVAGQGGDLWVATRRGLVQRRGGMPAK
jgi:ligand-binding sensor domain-containing protein